MTDETTIMEDVIRIRRDMSLFMLRCRTISMVLNEQSVLNTGSSAIGFAAMGSAFEQCSKVFRNYLQAVDKEIEEVSPGLLQQVEVDAAAAASLQPFVVDGVSYNFQVSFLQTEQTGDETLKDTDMRLFTEYELLELLRPVGITAEEDSRRQELFSNFYTYRAPE